MSVPTDEQLVVDLEKKINELLQDELLSNVPRQPTLKELDALIAVENHRAYKITIDRSPLPSIDLIVRQNSTVREIKRLFRIQVERLEQAAGDHTRKISWKYIWKTFCFVFQNTRLADDDAVVSQIGIKQNSVLTLARLTHAKGTHQKAWKRRIRQYHHSSGQR
ncbi:hypothetical protein BDF20DRAFT_986370 [Mycotypha africana]|uniref:uncharacterized protein n=1 Tax=Mycotypha africana TaxID=64632 RepID=UPI00230149AD|nr:uncharacterized protein BDF20DRAFT_986370 [Mycotypha africana]KAI8984491.1 hypothetical protein BDF20DRAFT_986370 [Mycotypha africana]